MIFYINIFYLTLSLYLYYNDRVSETNSTYFILVFLGENKLTSNNKLLLVFFIYDIYLILIYYFIYFR